MSFKFEEIEELNSNNMINFSKNHKFICSKKLSAKNSRRITLLDRNSLVIKSFHKIEVA